MIGLSGMHFNDRAVLIRQIQPQVFLPRSIITGLDAGERLDQANRGIRRFHQRIVLFKSTQVSTSTIQCDDSRTRRTYDQDRLSAQG